MKIDKEHIDIQVDNIIEYLKSDLKRQCYEKRIVNSSDSDYELERFRITREKFDFFGDVLNETKQGRQPLFIYPFRSEFNLTEEDNVYSPLCFNTRYVFNVYDGCNPEYRIFTYSLFIKDDKIYDAIFGYEININDIGSIRAIIKESLREIVIKQQTYIKSNRSSIRPVDETSVKERLAAEERKGFNSDGYRKWKLIEEKFNL